MTTLVGTSLPEHNLTRMGANGPEKVSINELTGGRKIIIFAVPGAFTPTCSKTHFPGFVDQAEALRAKGVEGIYCLTVNDIFVTSAWSEIVGAKKAGVEVLADTASAFTKAIGMNFSNPDAGMIDRSRRYAMIIDDGKVIYFDVEEDNGTCSISSAAHLLSVL